MSTEHDDIDLIGPPPEDLETRRRRDEAGRALFAEYAPNLMRIGRFELERQLGSGGQGVVYVARDPKLDRAVALKRLGMGNPRHVERMREEALALARVSHDNVVKVFEVDEDETGRPFLVMELVEGQSLREWLAAEPRPWTAIVDLFIVVGDGLVAVHDAGMIHRDIKPTNVMITADGRAKLVDLGIASLRAPVGDPPSASPETGPSASPAVVGTWSYMAPEQRLGRADARSDQYSFCVALHEALYGEPPTSTTARGDGTPGSAAADGTTKAEPQPEVRRAVGIRKAPRQLGRAIARGLQEDPERRHPDMRALVEELRRIRRERSRWPLVGLVVVLGMAGTYMSTRAGQPGPCSDLEAAQRLWRGEREAVRTALEGTQSPEATATFAEVDAMLAATAKGLDERRTETCKGDGADERTRDHRLAQLDEQHEMLAGMMGSLGRLDAASVVDLPKRLSGSLSRLHAGPQDACELQPPSIDDGTEAEEVQALMYQGIAEGVAGRYDEALELTKAAAERAKDATLTTLRAKLLLEHGRLAVEARRWDEARGVLEEARSLTEQHDCDGLGAEALALGAKVPLLESGPPVSDVVDLKSRLALEKLDSLGDLVGPRRAEALNTRALVLQNQGRLDDAVETYQRAIEICQSFDPPAELELSASLHNLGITQAKQGKPEEAIATLERARALREQVLGPEHPSLYRIHAGLSHRWLDLGELERAEEALETALRLAQGLGANNPRVANLHIAMVQVLDRRHEWDRALEHAEKADEILEDVYGERGPKRVASLEAIGQICLDAGRPKDAIPALELALELHTASGSRGLDLAIGRGKLAQAHFWTGRADVAIQIFEDVARTFQDPTLQDDPFYPEFLLYQGEALIALDREAEARGPLRAAVNWWTKQDSNPERLALARWELARVSCNDASSRNLAHLALDYFAAQDTEVAGKKQAAITAWLHNGCPATDETAHGHD